MPDSDNRSHNILALPFPSINSDRATFRPSTSRCHGVLLFFWILWIATMAQAQTLRQAEPKQTLNWFTLTADEAMKGLPVDLEGTVLCYDLGWGQLYIHNGLSAIYLNPRTFTNRFEVGQQVRIHGTTAWNGTATILTNTTAVVEGRLPTPPAQLMKVGDLARFAGQWVEVHGRIRVAEASRDRVTIVLNDGNQRCLVYVMQTSSTNQFRQLVDAEVKILGINASRSQDEKLEAAILFCPGLDQITILNPASSDRRKLPVTSIDSLLTSAPDGWANQPVHINGIVSNYQPGELITLKDPTGIVSAEVIQVDPVVRDQRIDLWGFPSVRNNRLVLEGAWFEITKRNPIETNPAATAKPVPYPEFTSIRQVRSLPKDRANQHLSARVRGTLTYVDSEWHVVFLQDDQDAIFLDTAQSDLQSGQIVEVTGQTDGSGFAPQLINCVTKILGKTNLPAPIKVELQDAANGHLDSRWVEMEGVCASRQQGEWPRVNVTDGSGWKIFSHPAGLQYQWSSHRPHRLPDQPPWSVRFDDQQPRPIERHHPTRSEPWRP